VANERREEGICNLRTNGLSIIGAIEKPRTLLLSPGTEPTPTLVPMVAGHAEIINGPSSTFPALQGTSDPATIAKSLQVKGEVLCSGWLYIDGKVEGAINLAGGRVTVSRDAQVEANISAREVVVLGKVRGNIDASDRVDIRSESSLIGDVITQRISIGDGAFFKGSMEIGKSAQRIDGRKP
jgi:cytoskeletal protein CcmA (bactofilin family)